MSKSWSWIKRIEDRAWSNSLIENAWFKLDHARSSIRLIIENAWFKLDHARSSIRLIIENAWFKLDHARSSIRLIQDHDFDNNHKTRNRNPDSEHLWNHLNHNVFISHKTCFWFSIKSETWFCMILQIKCTKRC